MLNEPTDEAVSWRAVVNQSDKQSKISSYQSFAIWRDIQRAQTNIFRVCTIALRKSADKPRQTSVVLRAKCTRKRAYTLLCFHASVRTRPANLRTTRANFTFGETRENESRFFFSTLSHAKRLFVAEYSRIREEQWVLRPFLFLYYTRKPVLRVISFATQFRAREFFFLLFPFSFFF